MMVKYGNEIGHSASYQSFAGNHLVSFTSSYFTLTSEADSVSWINLRVNEGRCYFSFDFTEKYIRIRIVVFLYVCVFNAVTSSKHAFNS
jgi:hypothetical protein